LRGLTEIAREEKLGELEVEQNGIRIILRAVAANSAASPLPAPAYFPMATGAVETPMPLVLPSTSVGSIAASAPAENLIEIVSPMVGVFYRAPSPADSNFIEIGDKVEVGQTVALVEAMKVFNEIVAEVSGVVAEIKSASADLVETGQTIITLRAA